MSVRRCLAGAAALLVLGSITTPFTASAESLPFNDPNANGYIGFCDAHGNSIHSGTIGAAPFVAMAVSSVPAPAGYGTPSGRGVLNVYQPRKDVDPGDWSGKQLTAASIFTNASHPMAQGTGLDPALVDFVSVFPPKWDGLVQLRMYITAPNKPQHSIPYPATVIRVSGKNWSVVSGGDVACSVGSATSVEYNALPTSRLNSPTARATPGARSSSAAHTDGGKSGSSRGPGAAGAAQPSGAPGAAIDGAPAAASARNSGGNGAAVPVILSAIGALAAAGAVSVLIRRRRRSA